MTKPNLLASGGLAGAADLSLVSLGRPHYFGSDERRRRFSMVHWPAGDVRGGVVMCPPLAYEAVCSHASLRSLAQRLAGLGLAVMRIEYDGTANSVGADNDDGRVPAWQATVFDALSEMQSFDVGPVHLLGLRFGATLASCAIAAGDLGPAVGGAVLWDPVLSGRRYSRELRMLSGSSGLRPDSIHGGIAVAGTRFSDATLAELKRIELQPVEVPCLLISRSEAVGAADPTPHLGPDTEEQNLPGTAAMLDTDAELAVPPPVILDAICDWFDQRFPARGRTVPPPPVVGMAREPTTDLDDTVDTGSGGDGMIHRAGRVGAGHLFQITTTPAGVDAPTRAVVMLNNGLAPFIGPGRSWVELAHRVAQHGWAAVRLDLSGIGDSPARPGFAPGESYPVHAGTDIAEVVAHLAGEGIGEIALIGLCSGAILAFDGARATPGVDVIVSINGRFDRPFFDARRHRSLRAAPLTNRVLAVPLRKTPLLAYFARVPTLVWRFLDRVRLVADPTRAIADFVAAGGEVRLIFGEHEWGLIALRQRGGKRFRELLANRRVRMDICPGLDHSMFDLTSRAEVIDLVMAHLCELWPAAKPDDVSPSE